MSGLILSLLRHGPRHETPHGTLSAPTEQTTTVSYATENGSALAGTDYTAQSGTVTFAPGQTSATLTVATTDDIWGGESNEFFYVNLSNPQNATLANSQATGTITEDGDDVLPSISVNAQPALESSGWMMFAITLSATIDAPIAVDYATADGIGPDAAISGEDYAGGSGTLTFNPGEAGIDLWFGLNRDPWFNADETFSLNLSNPTHAVIAVGSATGTIQQGPPPTLSIGAGTANESAGAISFPVTLSEASGVTTTVDYATSDGVGADAALAGEDYTTTTGTLRFAPGVTTQTITVPLLPDAYHAGNETFQVALVNPQNATLATATASGTIAQGPPPAISIADATANEGAVETFTLTLSQASEQAITVQYSTADGSAKASTDYTAVSNATATFAAGTTQTTIAVPTSDDDTMIANESNETFVVNLSNPQGATLGAARGTATIVEDADQPSISIADASGPESGGSLTFVVTTSPPSNTAVTVNYATADGTGANAALSGEDYAHTTGTITLNPGVTSQNISVPLYNDTYHPADETFFVNLSSASNAAIGRAQAIGAIQQGPLPTISIPDASQTEPASGSLLIYFSVTLSRIEDVPVTVAYATADGAGTDGATSPEDYTATSGTVTFNPGETQHAVGITLNSDPYHPANETFFVNLSAPTNATVARGQAIGNITQGPPPGMVIGSAWADEGSTVVFPITLYGTSDEAITFAYQTADGSATAGMDYASSSGTAIIPAGQTGTTISVPTLDDDAQITNEPNQTFYLNLLNPQGATLESSQGTGTVIEDDDRPSISVADVSAPESAGSLTFTVTLSTPSATTVFVNYATADGAWPDAAIGGEDYGWTGGGLAFAPGVTSQSVTVPLYNDAYHPTDENFFLNLSSATNATIARYQATGTIVQGAPPTVSIADASQQEPASGSAAMNFTLTLSQAADVPVTVNYTTADGSAVAAQGDYQPVTGGTVTFPAGRTQATASVSINADELDGLNEQFYVNLGDPQNATIARGTATGTILEVNGGQPTISITGGTQPETAGQLTFTVSLSAPTTQTVNVDFNTSDGTAVSSEDYTGIPPGTLTFAPGQTSQTVQVSLASDPWSPTDEVFYGNLSNPSNATIAVAQATGTITQGPPPDLNIDDVTAKETDVNMVFTVTLSQKGAYKGGAYKGGHIKGGI